MRIIVKNGRPPLPKFHSATHQPEKIWVDKGREISGEFASFCRSKDIVIYPTKSETKSALAERNNRSLNPLIFKYMHEHDRNSYIDEIDQFASSINYRVNRMTNMVPVSISKKDVPYLVSLCHTNVLRQPKFKIGDQVQIRRKIDTFHQEHEIQFTQELFTVTSIPTCNPPTYTVKDRNNKIIQGNFNEHELLKVVVPS